MTKKLLLKTTITFVFLTVLFGFAYSSVLAQLTGTPGTVTGIHNPVLDVFGKGEGGEIIAQLIGRFLHLALIIAGVVLLVMIILAGYDWLSSAGEKEKIQKAQQRLTNAFIGFVLVVAARAILGYLAGVLEIEWLKTLKIELPTF